GSRVRLVLVLERCLQRPQLLGGHAVLSSSGFAYYPMGAGECTAQTYFRTAQRCITMASSGSGHYFFTISICSTSLTMICGRSRKVDRAPVTLMFLTW